jgi:hypothetical protein
LFPISLDRFSYIVANGSYVAGKRAVISLWSALVWAHIFPLIHAGISNGVNASKNHFQNIHG